MGWRGDLAERGRMMVVLVYLRTEREKHKRIVRLAAYIPYIVER